MRGIWKNGVRVKGKVAPADRLRLIDRFFCLFVVWWLCPSAGDCDADPRPDPNLCTDSAFTHPPPPSP